MSRHGSAARAARRTPRRTPRRRRVRSPSASASQRASRSGRHRRSPGSYAGVMTTSPPTRSGALSASHSSVWAPIEAPASTARSIPSRVEHRLQVEAEVVVRVRGRVAAPATSGRGRGRRRRSPDARSARATASPSRRSGASRSGRAAARPGARRRHPRPPAALRRARSRRRPRRSLYIGSRRRAAPDRRWLPSVAMDVTESNFQTAVIDRSHELPGRRRLLGRVVRTLPPARAGARARGRGARRARSSSPRSTPTPTRCSRGPSGSRASRRSRRSGTARSPPSSSAPSRRPRSSASSTRSCPPRPTGSSRTGDEAVAARGGRARADARRRRRAAGPDPARARRARRGARAARRVPGSFAADGLAARIELEQRRRRRRAGPRRRVRRARRRRPRARRSTCCSTRCPTADGARTTSAACRRRSSTSSASSTRSRASRAAGSPPRCTELRRAQTRQRQLLVGSASTRLQAGDPDAQQPHRPRRREPPQQLERDRPDAIGGAHRLGERARAGVGREVVEPDLDPDRAPAPLLATRRRAQPLDQPVEHRARARAGSAMS